MVNIGLVGLGHLGEIHLNCLLETPFELAGIYDLDIEKAQKLGNRFGIEVFESLEELISNCDAIDIVTPTLTHHSIAKKVLHAKKHVFIEKPLTDKLSDAYELQNLASRYGCIVQIGHVERFNPAYTALEREILAPGFIEAHRLSGFSKRGTDVSVVLDLMIHDLDLILALVDDEVVEIRANGLKFMSEHTDICNARITFAKGCVANLTASRISMKNMRKFRFFQKDAYISMDFLEKEAQVFRLLESADNLGDENKITIDTIKGKKHIRLYSPPIEKGNAIRDELLAFHESIIHGMFPIVGIDDAIKALQLAYDIELKVKENNYN